MRTRGTSGQSGRLVCMCVCVDLVTSWSMGLSLTHTTGLRLCPLQPSACTSCSDFYCICLSLVRAVLFRDRYVHCTLVTKNAFCLSLSLSVASVHFLINVIAFTGFNNNNRTIHTLHTYKYTLLLLSIGVSCVSVCVSVTVDEHSTCIRVTTGRIGRRIFFTNTGYHLEGGKQFRQRERKVKKKEKIHSVQYELREIMNSLKVNSSRV